MNAVVTSIERLARDKPVRDYVIGRLYTGKHEWSWDSRSGTYSESLPVMSHDAFVLQMALTNGAVLRRRTPSEVRQK